MTEMPDTLRVTFDGCCEGPNEDGGFVFSFAIPAVRIASYWNGWAVPVLSRDAVEELCAWDATSGARPVFRLNATGTLSVFQDGLETHYVRPDADGHYSFDGFCFDVMDPADTVAP